jgi:hypothetical protein
MVQCMESLAPFYVSLVCSHVAIHPIPIGALRSESAPDPSPSLGRHGSPLSKSKRKSTAARPLNGGFHRFKLATGSPIRRRAAAPYAPAAGDTGEYVLQARSFAAVLCLKIKGFVAHILVSLEHQRTHTSTQIYTQRSYTCALTGADSWRL